MTIAKERFKLAQYLDFCNFKAIKSLRTLSKEWGPISGISGYLEFDSAYLGFGDFW